MYSLNILIRENITSRYNAILYNTDASQDSSEVNFKTVVSGGYWNSIHLAFMGHLYLLVCTQSVFTKATAAHNHVHAWLCICQFTSLSWYTDCDHLCSSHIVVQLRQLEILLRQTEILFSLCKLKIGTPVALAVMETETSVLSEARQTLSWLLHHDAITGRLYNYKISRTDMIRDPSEKNIKLWGLGGSSNELRICYRAELYGTFYLQKKKRNDVEINW